MALPAPRPAFRATITAGHREPGSLTLVEEREEVDGVLGDQCAVVGDGRGQYIGIGCSAQADGPNVHRIVAVPGEKLDHLLAVHLVEQEPHSARTAARAAVRRRARSRAASFASSRASISSMWSAA